VTAFRPLILAVSLLGVGFAIGYGFQSRSAQQQAMTTVRPSATPQAPQVKGLHASPDGKLLAFTGVYARSENAGLWVLDPATGIANGRPSPTGWQDFVTQWRSDGRSLLVEREKIPRPVEDATGGLYTAPVDVKATASGELEPINEGDLPQGEKIMTGLLAPNGALIIKTRREPKALYKMNGSAQLIDRASLTYGQNRPVVEGGKLVFYVVRDIPGQPQFSALFRVVDGKSSQLSPAWEDVSWSYVAPSGKQLLVARSSEDGVDWNWTLYKIGAQKIEAIKSATVPADVISVYWSPDEKRVLGAAGEKLWIIDVPSLKTTQLGNREKWNADDASWVTNSTVAVAEGGEIWSLTVPDGKATKLWRFPAEFWN
jgi:hypothetical protein